MWKGKMSDEMQIDWILQETVKKIHISYKKILEYYQIFVNIKIWVIAPTLSYVIDSIEGDRKSSWYSRAV